MVQFSPVLLSPILFLLTISTNAFDWQPGNNGQVKWSLNCDFYGNDIGSESSRGEDCGGICINNPQCTHFTYSNGVCYLKNNPNSPTAVDSNGAVCGWVERPDGSHDSKVPAKATYWAEQSDPGGCQMPGTINYAITDAVALGQATSLGNLAWRQGLCGQVLSVDCGNGVLNAVVASTCNLGSTSCGVDLIGPTWRKATNNQPPGIAQCQVALTKINPMQSSGSPLCFYRPNSPTDNPYYASLGVFNTNGRIPSSATLGNNQGVKGSGDSYFNFNSGSPTNSGDTVTFNFEDGSSNSFGLGNCTPGGSTRIF